MKDSKLKKLIAFAKLTYQKNHFCLRWLFSPIIIIYRLIYQFNYKLRSTVWIISGNNPSKTPLTIIFAGEDQNKNYIARLAFDDSYSEKFIGRTWKWNLTRIVNKRAQDCSLMVFEVDEAFPGIFDSKKTFFIPRWIGQETDISPDNSWLIKYKNQVNKYNLQYEVTNERYQFDKFYNDMYLPYITKAHGNNAVVASYYEKEKCFKNGDLLFIKKDKEFIGGELIVYEKNGPRLAGLGVKDGNTDYLKVGVMVAIYYFAIKYLKQKGYKKLHFGSARAFLNDGALRYKKRWRLQIVKDKDIGFLVKPLSMTVGVKDFFLRNPFIYLDQGKFYGAIFMENDQLHSKEDLEKVYKDHYQKGLSKLNIFLFGDNEKDIRKIIPSELSERISIYSAESIF